MIIEIIKEAKLTGAKDERLPYPIGNDPISKADSAMEEKKSECSKYPYRRVVGQLMYGMVHTMIGIMYALNVLSRYGNNPGPRHIEFLKHLLKYCKYSKMDRLMFHTHDGPTDIDTMTKILQLQFQCDADLGGNLDNGHSQTSYIGVSNMLVLNGSRQCVYVNSRIRDKSCQPHLKVRRHLKSRHLKRHRMEARTYNNRRRQSSVRLRL